MTTVGASEPSALLVANHVTTRFETARGVLTAVDDVSLSLAEGETLGIVGESGSGKSVLVRTLMNLLERSTLVAAESEILYQGRDVRTLDPVEARHFWGTEMAMIFQDPMTSLNPVKRIGVQVMESMRFHLGLSKAEARGRALDLLAQVGIPDPARRLDQYPHELSGGMRQRVTIAIALSCEPRLLIADEPTTALDVTVQKQILDLLDRLQAERRMAMILITHDLGVVAGHADRVALMYAGQLVELGATVDLFEHTAHPYAEALLRSIPRLDQPSGATLDVIPGRIPDMVAPPTGCRFAPRCHYAAEDCTVTEVEMRPAPGAGAHSVRCVRPLGLARAANAQMKAVR